MPVFNCEKYVEEAVESILSQTYRDFELIIIDDASSDNTLSILKKYNDPRIRLIEKPSNNGYTRSLNLGLNIARGKYLARMDGDDVSMPERLLKQVSFLEANPDVILCGTSYKIIGGEDKMIKPPETHAEIKLALLRGNCIAHPTVMLRKEVLDQNSLFYDPSKEPSEDYDLWVRMILLGKFHNLQEVLVNYRLHNASVSRKRVKEQEKNTVDTQIKLLNYLSFELKAEEINLLENIFTKGQAVDLQDVKAFEKFKKKLFASNSKGFFEFQGFLKYLDFLDQMILRKFTYRYSRYNPGVFFDYNKTKIYLKSRLSRTEEYQLFLKSIFFWKI